MLMSQKTKILELLRNKTMTRGELAFEIYGDHKHGPNIYTALIKLVQEGYVIRTGNNPSYYSHSGSEVVVHNRKKVFSKLKTDNLIVPHPSKEQVQFWLDKWNNLEDYKIQEEAINELFAGSDSTNKELKNIMIKCSVLNDFYSTSIFKIYPVACRILELDIDDRLTKGDITLVNDIASVVISGKKKNFYSFATKYCSHHNEDAFPIYDSYVDAVLRYFRDVDSFAEFNNSELKNYERFKNILFNFRNFYGLTDFSLKELDKYLWQLGKFYFPKTY